MGKLDGKVAIVTGAASGIGEAGALLFAGEGARVVAVDVTAEGVEATVEAIRSAGGEALGSTTDVSDLGQVQAMVDATIAAYGQIDILWNNAGILRGTSFTIEELPVEIWHEVLGVNLDGVFHGVRCVIPHMKSRRRGAIVSTASMAGLVAHLPGLAPYTASKGAVIALTRLLALELAGYNIRVNCIAPGAVRTNIRRGEETSAGNPFGVEWEAPMPLPETDATRRAEPIELAHTALYLVSDEAGPLTGITIAHDGGRTSR